MWTEVIRCPPGMYGVGRRIAVSGKFIVNLISFNGFRFLDFVRLAFLRNRTFFLCNILL
jgi:hypothetical protein